MDILLDKDGDIAFDENGDIILENSIAQEIRIHLQWFLEEWRWNKDYGMPYFEKFLKKNVNLSSIEGMVKQELLSIDGILDATVSVALDSKTRVGTIQFVAYTDSETVREEVRILYG